MGAQTLIAGDEVSTLSADGASSRYSGGIISGFWGQAAHAFEVSLNVGGWGEAGVMRRVIKHFTRYS